jgi:hypothetical protein
MLLLLLPLLLASKTAADAAEEGGGAAQCFRVRLVKQRMSGGHAALGSVSATAAKVAVAQGQSGENFRWSRPKQAAATSEASSGHKLPLRANTCLFVCLFVCLWLMFVCRQAM